MSDNEEARIRALEESVSKLSKAMNLLTETVVMLNKMVVAIASAGHKGGE